MKERINSVIAITAVFAVIALFLIQANVSHDTFSWWVVSMTT